MSDAKPPAKDGLDGVKKGLGQKVGPLPVWVWMAAILGGIAIAYYVRRSSAAGDAADPDRATDTAPGVGGAAGTGNVVDQLRRPTNNEEWLQRAVEILVGKGYNPLVVYTALRKYIDGGSVLSTQEQAIVAAAIRELGPPPEYVPAPIPGDGGGGGDPDPDPDPGGGGGVGGGPYVPPVDLPGHTWPGDGTDWNDPNSWSDDWDAEPPNGWDGGGKRPPAGEYITPEGVHAYYAPVNANPHKTVSYWTRNGGQNLKDARPYGENGEFTYTPAAGTPRGNPRPDGRPGYIPGQAR